MLQTSGSVDSSFAGYSKHFWTERIPVRQNNKLIWSNRWYNPSDLRFITPVQAVKFPTSQPNASNAPAHYVPVCEPSIKSFSRASKEKDVYPRCQSTRCEEWSTLRQMYPSKGHVLRHLPPKWGTDFDTESHWSKRRQTRFPHINSPMTV